MRKFIVVMFCSLLWGMPFSVAAERYIVDNGEPRAIIVTPPDPAGSVALAARELQAYIEKISGATLSITNTRTMTTPLHIFVGRSAHTDRLGVYPDGLRDGGFVMRTLRNGLVLLGDDSEFMPVAPFAMTRNNVDRVREIWDEVTGGLWVGPGSAFRSYNKILDLWSQSRRGTLNAVYEFLRTLGVRWYMPGDLGEIVPQSDSIVLPELDRVVQPVFPLRFMSFARFGTAHQDHVLWALRLGVNNPHGYQIAHGLRPVASRQEMRQAHPEYYAMFKGERRPQGAHVCYSSEALVQENARYARALFDILDFPMVSIMPEDGFTHACECPECLAQSTPERGAQGRYSDYVWNYVERVARELMKTHPDRLVSCCAYSTYRLPPEKIERFSPNVVVGIVGGRSPWTIDPEGRAKAMELQQAWAAKTEHKLFIFENYPFTNRMKYFIPRLFPHGIAQSMREVQDISFGESIWMGESRGLHAAEFNHLNYYVTARMYWDIDADIDALLEEYYRLYFGPAAAEMQAFVEHCQAHAGSMRVNPHPSRKMEVLSSIDRVFALLEAARVKAGADNVYAERIEKMAEWLVTLQEMRDQIAQGRENVPELAIREIPHPKIILDGNPDEPAWHDIPWQAYRDLNTGEKPVVKTFFKAFWADNALYLAIRCEDPDTQSLSITAPQNDDTRIWRGDAVELLVETDEHSFYQMVVDPAGSLTDLDRNVTKNDLSWNSQALVSARVAEDAWYVEMKIPVVDFSDDPLNNLVGNKPTREMPWHFNFCRQRLRDDGNEFSAFAPTGTRTFAVMMKFAKMYVE